MDLKKNIIKLVQDSIFSLNYFYEDKEKDLLSFLKKDSLLIENKKSMFGDFSFPCFQLSRFLKKDPVSIAQDIFENINKSDNFLKNYLSDIKIEKAFINFYLNKKKIIKNYFLSFKKKPINRNPEHVIIEYASPNIAKPLSISHLRSSILGEFLARLYLSLGNKVTRINYIGDWGTPFAGLVYFYQEWQKVPSLKKLLHPLSLKNLFDLYLDYHKNIENNPELKDKIQDYLKRLEQNDSELKEIWQKIRDTSLEEQKKIFELLDIHFDVYLSESFSLKNIPKAFEVLNEKKLISQKDEAQVIDLSSFNLGFVVLAKKNQTTLYSTRDIASALYRKEKWNFSKSLYVVGNEQSLYFKQIKKILELIGYDKEIYHIEFGMIQISDKKLSTRKGKVIFLMDVIKKVYQMILKKMGHQNKKSSKKIAFHLALSSIYIANLKYYRQNNIPFDWKEILNSKGETGIYLQYTHARLSSLLRKFEMLENKKVKKLSESFSGDFENLEIYELIKSLNSFHSILNKSLQSYQPAFLARYLINLCQLFSQFYEKEPILKEKNYSHKIEKIILVYYVRFFLNKGLKILGVKPLNKI